MIKDHNFEVIEALDLVAIKAKLMHKGGKNWTLERATTVEREYRRFLYLMKKFPNEPTSPLVDVDTFWHYHILDTAKYAADCQRVFGYFLLHFPYVGMRGEEDEKALQRMGERMRAIYEQTFGEDYLRRVAPGASQSSSRSSGVSLAAAYGGSASAVATDATPAYCTVTSAERAECMESAEAAYCTFTIAEPAYCTFTIADAAYCTSTMATAPRDNTGVEAAYCTSASALTAASNTHTEAAYCTRGHEAVFGSASKSRESKGERAPEERVGFYLERPGLAAA
jgi:hypothetical protein